MGSTYEAIEKKASQSFHRTSYHEMSGSLGYTERICEASAKLNYSGNHSDKEQQFTIVARCLKVARIRDQVCLTEFLEAFE